MNTKKQQIQFNPTASIDLRGDVISIVKSFGSMF